MTTNMLSVFPVVSFSLSGHKHTLRGLRVHERSIGQIQMCVPIINVTVT